MITVSLCMIVKNEEEKLPNCLKSLEGLFDEMLIADTGSTDRTKEIAESFGAKVFDFPWVGDFAKARNFILSKARGDYVYSADADEELDEENRQKFLQLKEMLDPEIEIVEMYYANQLAANSVYNFDRELRPKLFKRLRSFVWEGAIHEQLRIEPVIYESDIEIMHKPSGSHSERDLEVFRRLIEREGTLSSRLHMMYCRELYKAGSEDDLKKAAPYMEQVIGGVSKEDDIRLAQIVLAKTKRLEEDNEAFLNAALSDIASGGSSEMCCELGDYHLKKGNPQEAMKWYENAVTGVMNFIDLKSSGERAYLGTAECLKAFGDIDGEMEYRQKAENAAQGIVG